MIGERDIGYLAGILDGEGTVYTNPMRLSAYGTDENLLEWLIGRVGGSWNRRAACAAGCEREHVHSRRDGWQWYAHGCRAALILPLLIPAMVVKQDRAIQALTEWETRGSKPGSVDAARRDLARRGWPIEPPGHGELRHYRAGCRCTECRAANAAAKRKQRAAA